MQDIAFTICYLLFGLRGYWSDRHYDYMMSNNSTPMNNLNDWLNSTIAAGNNNNNNNNNETLVLGHLFVQSADANVPSMEKSWIVHTAILPACMISPLWWRFLQTIRQSYDTEQRWPYLGNSLKYFLAAQVAMLGVYHPSLRQSSIWICSFVIATLYQVFILLIIYLDHYMSTTFILTQFVFILFCYPCRYTGIYLWIGGY
jgi:EXS family